MNNELNNFFENKNYQRTRNLIPHNSRLNNYKSNRYFTIDDNTNLMKEALTKYRESQQKSEKNDFTNNKSLHSNASTADITKISKGKQKFNKNNTIKLDKNILYFAEKSKRIQQFHKINPKVIESITIDDLENYNEKETINENNNNNKEKRNIIYKKSRINDYNKNLKLQKNKKKFDVTIDMSNNDETVINENDEDESETIFYESEYQKVDNSISNNNYNNLNPNPNITKLFNTNDINFEYLLMIEKLFGDLTKDIEVNKMEKYINKLAIIKDFLYIFNDEDGFKILDRIDSIIMKDNNNIFLMIKEYLIEQLIFFYTIIIIELIKKDKNNFYSGLHSLIFYFHQNFIIFLNLIITNIIISSEQRENIYKKNECIKIINENKTWLDKTDFKEYLLTNNKISKQTLINLLNQIKSYFQTNNNNIQNSPFKRMNQNKITDTIINLFLTRITNPKSPKLSDLVKELKTFPSINYLLESLNINKISSNYPSEQNQEQEVYEFDSEEENPNENDNLVFNIIENDTEKTIRQDKEQTPKKFYLNPINPKYKYTLVLDLDETLVHYISDNESAYIQIRPGTEDFIKDLSKYYEIIIFTAALKKYADVVINSIDPDGNISYRLYRQHTISIGNSNIKDLTKLGRDLRYVIIVDNCLENFALQSRNGLKILDFEGNEFDDELEYLKDDLIKLVKMNVNDVRDYLENIQISMDKRAKFYEKLNFNINNNNNNINNFNNELVNYKDYYNDNINLDENRENINKKSQKEHMQSRYSYNNDYEDL
jgi:Dullard-like phosphatase family protein